MNLSLPLRSDYATLHGFWRESANVPSGLRLIYGDPVKFEKDRKRARERSLRRLGHYSSTRSSAPFIISWNQWDFTEESWR